MKRSLSTITVNNQEISFFNSQNNEFISLTDIARIKNFDEPKDVVKNWFRTKSTIEFIGLWERINNRNFKGVEFDSLLNEAGNNSFTLSPSKWTSITNAIGIISKSGRGGGTFAHKDIAFEFAAWISAEFKLYMIKEFQRLKSEDSKNEQLNWNLQRTISKINYRIHTDAIKYNIIPGLISKGQINFVYSDEADLLNVAIFCMTAKEWRKGNPGIKGNIRDFATIQQLIVLSNLESINAILIEQKIPTTERIIQLNKIAISQMKSLISSSQIKSMKK